MFEKIINSKLFQYIMTVTIAILTVILTQGLVARRELAKSVKEEIANKATYEYVNRQDAGIKSEIESHIVESTKTDAATMELIKSMDHKIDILLSKNR